MSWTKRQLVNDVFAELAIANWEFDLDPEDWEYVLRRMDMLMASLGTAGARLGYQLASSPDNTDLDQDSGLAEDAVLFAISNVAITAAPRFGKTVSAETRLTAKQTKVAIMARCAEITPMQFDKTLPVGAGNKPWRGVNAQFFETEDPLTIGKDADLTP